MAFSKCIKALNTAAGRVLSDDEIEALYSRFGKAKDELQGKFTDPAELHRAAADLASQKLMAEADAFRTSAPKAELQADKIEDPAVTEAMRVADTMPDLMIPVGEDADGNPILKNAREHLDDIRQEVALAENDANLFTVAAQCLMGAA